MNMTKKEVIERLCELQKEVSDVINPHWAKPMDCFCHRQASPFYENCGDAIRFIETAVRLALADLGEREEEERRHIEWEEERSRD